MHVAPLPGFKASALNFALAKTDPAAVLVSLVSSFQLPASLLGKGVVSIPANGVKRKLLGLLNEPQQSQISRLKDKADASCWDAACPNSIFVRRKISRQAQDLVA